MSESNMDPLYEPAEEEDYEMGQTAEPYYVPKPAERPQEPHERHEYPGLHEPIFSPYLPTHPAMSQSTLEYDPNTAPYHRHPTPIAVAATSQSTLEYGPDSVPYHQHLTSIAVAAMNQGTLEYGPDCAPYHPLPTPFAVEDPKYRPMIPHGDEPHDVSQDAQHTIDEVPPRRRLRAALRCRRCRKDHQPCDVVIHLDSHEACKRCKERKVVCYVDRKPRRRLNQVGELTLEPPVVTEDAQHLGQEPMDRLPGFREHTPVLRDTLDHIEYLTQEANESDEEGPRKRLRVSKACRNCHLYHQPCDVVDHGDSYEACTACKDHDKECVLDQGPRKHHSRYDDLTRRVDKLDTKTGNWLTYFEIIVKTRKSDPVKSSKERFEDVEEIAWGYERDSEDQNDKMNSRKRSLSF